MSDRHPDLILLKNAFSLSRLVLSHRTAPCHHHPERLAEYHRLTRSTTEELCNVHFDDNSWSQAKPSAMLGGFGLRTSTDLALPDFLSSRAASNSLVNDILRQRPNTLEDNVEVRDWMD